MISIYYCSVDRIKIELLLFLITLFGKVFTELDITLGDKTWRKMAFQLACTNLVKKLLVTAAIGYFHIHVFSNFFKFILEINCLKPALAQYYLVELLLVNLPNLLKAVLKMMLKLLVNVQAPRILRVVFKRLEKLLQNILQVADFFCIF